MNKTIKQSHILLVVSCVVGLLLTSCDNFLDIKPYGKTIPETTEEYGALLNDLLSDIDGNTFSATTNSSDLFLSNRRVATFEECCDNLEVNLTEYPSGKTLSSYIGTLAGDVFYRHLYATISRCNMILDNYTQGRDTREGQDLVGTAYALRGVAYYQLIRMYCEPVVPGTDQPGVSIVTSFDMEGRPVRSTMDESVKQAEDDLKKALDCHIQNEMYRFNDDVVKFCLARLYFWAGRYEEAKSMALDVLQRHPLLDSEGYKKMMTARDGMAGNMLLRCGRIMQESDVGALNYLQYRPFSVRYLKLFVEKEKDVRYNLFVGKKRKNNKILFSGLRAAELQFIAMESCYHLGQTDEALRLLNQLRSHRIEGNEDYTMATLPPVDHSEYIQTDCKDKPLTPLIAAILNERRKEFYLEGDRFFELKRNGRPEFWVTINGLKYTNRKFMYTFPISANDIQLNPGIVQNPGYTEVIYE